PTSPPNPNAGASNPATQPSPAGMGTKGTVGATGGPTSGQAGSYTPPPVAAASSGAGSQSGTATQPPAITPPASGGAKQSYQQWAAANPAIAADPSKNIAAYRAYLDAPPPISGPAGP